MWNEHWTLNQLIWNVLSKQKLHKAKTKRKLRNNFHTPHKKYDKKLKKKTTNSIEVQARNEMQIHLLYTTYVFGLRIKSIFD